MQAMTELFVTERVLYDKLSCFFSLSLKLLLHLKIIKCNFWKKLKYDNSSTVIVFYARFSRFGLRLGNKQKGFIKTILRKVSTSNAYSIYGHNMT